MLRMLLAAAVLVSAALVPAGATAAAGEPEVVVGITVMKEVVTRDAQGREQVELAPRPVEIHHLSLVEQLDNNRSVFEAECGKGTYVRALARDIGRILGCFGHICALRRTVVGPWSDWTRSDRFLHPQRRTISRPQPVDGHPPWSARSSPARPGVSPTA